MIQFVFFVRARYGCLFLKNTGKNSNDLSVFGMHSAQTCHALTCIHTLNYTRNANNSMYFLVVTFSPFCLYLFSFYALLWLKKEYQNGLKEIFNGIYGKKRKKCKEKCGLDFKAIICDQAILDHYSFVASFGRST